MIITLKRLQPTTDNVQLVQRVLEGCPRFHELSEGSPAGPDAATKLFAAAPPGLTAEDKQVLAVLDGERPVGVAEVVNGNPRADVAHIGLLAIQESDQGRGVGRAACEAIERLARSWHSSTIRLGVLESNPQALAFWPRVGFRATGESLPWHEGTVTTTVIVFEKSLKQALSSGPSRSKPGPASTARDG